MRSAATDTGETAATDTKGRRDGHRIDAATDTPYMDHVFGLFWTSRARGALWISVQRLRAGRGLVSLVQHAAPGISSPPGDALIPQPPRPVAAYAALGSLLCGTPSPLLGKTGGRFAHFDALFSQEVGKGPRPENNCGFQGFVRLAGLCPAIRGVTSPLSLPSRPASAGFPPRLPVAFLDAIAKRWHGEQLKTVCVALAALVE